MSVLASVNRLFKPRANQLSSRVTANRRTELRYHLILLSALLTLVSACGGSAGIQPGEPLEQASAVSVTLPGFTPTSGTTLHWHRDLVWVDDPEGRFERRAKVLQQALEDQFLGKGFRFVADDATADYDVVAVAMLGDLEDHAEIQEFFRLYPSLAEPARGYGRGTVLVAITPAGSSEVVWRGALEVYTDPDKMPVAERHQRLRWAAERLLESIPTLP